MTQNPGPADSPEQPDRSEPPGFEEAIGEIETLIESIESGELGLDASIRAYERAAQLMKGCRGQLRAAELRVEEIGELMAEDASESEAD